MMEKWRKLFNEEMESVTSEGLAALHEEKFLAQVKYVSEKSPFYQDKFKQSDLDVSRIKNMDDIVKLPFTIKSELREAQMKNPPVGAHRACDVVELSRVYSSSGTTGIPTYLGLTARDISDIHAEAIARFCWGGGIRPDSIVVNIPTAPFIADTFREGIEKTGAVNFPTGFNTDRVLSAFQYQGANALHSTVSFWSYFLGEVEKAGLNPRELGIRTIVGGAEGGTKIIRPVIEESFGATVVEGMGMGEQCCTVWGECVQNRGTGMHYLAQGLVHVEIIHPETDRSLEIKEGVMGELVYTGLIQQGMPLLRYRSRDHVKVVSTKTCQCGRGGFRIEVLGRIDDMLTVLGVNVYPLAVKDVVSKLAPRVSGNIEIQLEKPGSAVEPPLKVKVELGESPGDKAELKKRVEQEIRSKLIFQAKVELVDELPQYQYKGKLIRKLYEE
ncbi:MAG: phenylacetate--CoA ligase family protein [Deltaproteobacteria bacterium]|nr:phenylacetate--CoA ligase family protein [Deltaproteobacteria bacterium]